MNILKGAEFKNEKKIDQCYSGHLFISKLINVIS